MAFFTCESESALIRSRFASWGLSGCY